MMRQINKTSLFIGIVICIILGYIILNEIFWVPNANPQGTFSNLQFWLILCPGLAILFWSFYDAFRQRQEPEKQSKDVKIDKIV